MKQLSLLFLTLAIFGSCTGGKSCAAKKVSLDTFVWQNHTDPSSLDPALVYDDRAFNIAMQIFEGLLEYHPETLEPIPAVATRWEVSPDGLTYTFYLRDNATWSDGSPVTATDFEYSWKRALDPKTASQTAYMLYFIKGAEDYSIGKTLNSDEVGVKALGLTTLQVTLTSPTPFFPQLVCYMTYRPVHRATVEQWGDRWTNTDHIVSNGPYRLVSFIPKQEVVIEKSPTYWDQENVRIARAQFLPIEDEETGLRRMLAGDIHYTVELPILKIEELSKRPDFHQVPVLYNYYYDFNTKRKPFDDVRVRKALNLAIDKQQLATMLRRGDLPATAFVPPGMGKYVSPPGPAFDPAQARALLAEAGYGDPTTFPKVTLLYNVSEIHKTAAEVIQNQWKTNLGIEVAVQNMEFKSLLAIRETRNFDIERNGWVGDYLDPNTFLNLFTSNSQQNYAQWSNPQFDDLVLNQAANERDPVKRMALLAQAEAMVLEDMPVIPLLFYTRPYLLDQRVKGFYGNAQVLHPLKFAWFEESK